MKLGNSHMINVTDVIHQIRIPANTIALLCTDTSEDPNIIELRNPSDRYTTACASNIDLLTNQ
jgi:hypothetical protein